jgi:hypothetical protein
MIQRRRDAGRSERSDARLRVRRLRAELPSLTHCQPSNPAAPRGNACAAVVHRKSASFGGVRSAGISGMSGSEQDKVNQLIKLLEKKKPLSASDIAAVQKLLAAGADVVNGRGESFK